MPWIQHCELLGGKHISGHMNIRNNVTFDKMVLTVPSRSIFFFYGLRSLYTITFFTFL